MKELNKLTFEESVRYSREHTWAKRDGNLFWVGISDYAQDQLGEIIFVELPQPGDSFHADETFGVVESAKSVSELYMPVSGEVVEVNLKLEQMPEIINRDPFQEGWMVKIKPSDVSESEHLLSARAYKEFLG
ncbi:MAG: glycine cleavage system protein GcvH [Proteobacteria bacterium]|nr:glycine cleavage system protein GcvH [Pseudomonadota bacterium]